MAGQEGGEPTKTAYSRPHPHRCGSTLSQRDEGCLLRTRKVVHVCERGGRKTNRIVWHEGTSGCYAPAAGSLPSTYIHACAFTTNATCTPEK